MPPRSPEPRQDHGCALVIRPRTPRRLRAEAPPSPRPRSSNGHQQRARRRPGELAPPGKGSALLRDNDGRRQRRRETTIPRIRIRGRPRALLHNPLPTHGATRLGPRQRQQVQRRRPGQQAAYASLDPRATQRLRRAGPATTGTARGSRRAIWPGSQSPASPRSNTKISSLDQREGSHPPNTRSLRPGVGAWPGSRCHHRCRGH